MSFFVLERPVGVDFINLYLKAIPVYIKSTKQGNERVFPIPVHYEQETVFELRSGKKRGLMPLREVSSQSSLCSPHSLIRDDTFLFFCNFRLNAVLF